MTSAVLVFYKVFYIFHKVIGVHAVHACSLLYRLIGAEMAAETVHTYSRKKMDETGLDLQRFTYSRIFCNLFFHICHSLILIYNYFYLHNIKDTQTKCQVPYLYIFMLTESK